MTRQGYLKNFWHNLKRSVLSIDKKIFVSGFHDLLFYLTSYFTVMIWSYLASRQASVMELNPLTFDFTNNATMQVAVDSLTHLLIFIFVSIAAFFVIAVLLFSFFKSLCWLVFTKKPLSLRFYRKFALLNLLWFSAWFALLFVISLTVMPTPALILMLILIALMIHFTIVLISQFVKYIEIAKSLRKTFAIGIKIHHFILPYLVIALGYLLVIQVLRILEIFKMSETTFKFVFMSAFAVISVLYFACARLYLLNCIKQLE